MVLPSVVTVRTRSGLGWNLSLADLSLGRGCQELVLVSCCVQGRGTHPRDHQPLPLSGRSLGAGTPGTRPRTSGSAAPPAGHGAAAPGAGKQRPFGLRHLLPSCRQMLGHRLCHPTVPSRSQGLCNHLTPSARPTAGDCLTCG